MTVVSIKGHAVLVGDKQSYQESKKPGRRPLRTLPSSHRDVINPSSIFSGGTVSRGLFGGRLADNECKHVKKQLTGASQNGEVKA